MSLDAYAGASVFLAFRYQGNASTTAAIWYVDDVEVPTGLAVADAPSLTCTTVEGTMVAGFVTDANTTQGLVGANVVRDLGGLATTMPATGNLPAGFYYMFSASPVITGPSTRTFTASMDGYGPVAHAVNLIVTGSTPLSRPGC